jgi:hypothetical protein
MSDSSGGAAWAGGAGTGKVERRREAAGASAAESARGYPGARTFGADSARVHSAVGAVGAEGVRAHSHAYSRSHSLTAPGLGTVGRSARRLAVKLIGAA